MVIAQASSAPDIRYVKGVGPYRSSQLLNLGIKTVLDACFHAPRRYEDRRELVLIKDLTSGEPVTIRGKLLARGIRRIRHGRTLLYASVGDNTGHCECVWFNMPYLKDQLNVGDDLIIYGRAEGGKKKQFIHPEFEKLEDEGDESLHMGRIVPIYPTTEGVGQRWLRNIIVRIVEEYASVIDDPIPDYILNARGWTSLNQALKELHFPTSWEKLKKARERLSFEELLLLQVSLAKRRARVVSKNKPQKYNIDGPITKALRENLPFKLTLSQEKVLEECLDDLSKSHPMQRLLQGDVGCGKTIVMVFLIAIVVQSGYQAALMAPTELLAEQHAKTIQDLLGTLGVSVCLLSQGVELSVRQGYLEELAKGKIKVAVGTHALIQGHVKFSNLSFVIIDEQHKFGVSQRALLAQKGDFPDVLVVTATPIPRTMALTLYGDLDVSTIRELPLGRQPITTRQIRESEKEELYTMLREALRSKRQAYVVYPLVEESNTLEFKAAKQMVKHLEKEFPEFNVGLLHGQMHSRDKESTMHAFAKGDIQLLVSTVIVEVGLDVPNATIMVIEHPGHFGLAQLHQLRGRIGRGNYPATCIVVSSSKEESIQGRLEVFLSTTDGFILAEADLAQRGPGELLGRVQHGWFPLRVANLQKDHKLLEEARGEARELVTRDPELKDPLHAGLKKRLIAMRQGMQHLDLAGKT